MNLKKTVALFLLFTCAVLCAVECSQCGKKIRGRYIKSHDNKVFCSEKCFARIAPKCVQCRKACIKGSYKLNDRDYCSEDCINQVMKCRNCGKPARPMHTIINQDGEKLQLCSDCTERPKCYFCALPYRTAKLFDGRYICEKCKKTSLRSKQEMQASLSYVRKILNYMFGFDMAHHIELIPVSLPELEKESKGIYLAEGGGRMALMRHEYEVVEKTDWKGRKTRSVRNEKCRIYVLTDTPAAMLDDAIAHELAHDFLRHNAGKVKDLKVEEGFAEAVAAKFNDQVKKSQLNIRKKNNPDPVYGDGYRMMSSMLDRKGFKATLQFIKSKAEPLL